MLRRGDPTDDGESGCMRPRTLGDAGGAGDWDPNRPENDMVGVFVDEGESKKPSASSEMDVFVGASCRIVQCRQ